MNDVRAQEVDEQPVKYRRHRISEAIELALMVFTLSSFLTVLWDLAFEDMIDFENAFYRSLYFSLAFSIASLVFKWKAVYRR